MIASEKKVGIKEKFARIPARAFWGVLIVVFIVFGLISYSHSGRSTNAQRSKSITQQLRCLECEGLSVYDSDTKTSKTIAKDVARRVTAGESNKKIFAYYEEIYGEYIRLAPTSESGNWLIYVMPAFFIAVLIVAIFLSISQRSTARTRLLFWGAAGLLFVIGLGVFVNNTHTSKVKTVAKQKRSTKELLQQAVDESPNNENLRSLAIVQFAQSKPDLVNALKNFDRAAALDPKDAESRGYAAYIVFLAEQYDQAKSRAQEAVAANNQDPTALFFRGAIYYQLPESDPAVKKANQDLANKDFDQVLALAPDSEFASEVDALRKANSQ